MPCCTVCTHDQQYRNAITKFNEIIGPNLVFNEVVHSKNHHLSELMDKKNLELFYQIAMDIDKARMKCLSNNGALTWLGVPYNMQFSIIMSNQEMFINISLVLGAKLTLNPNPICQNCPPPPLALRKKCATQTLPCTCSVTLTL